MTVRDIIISPDTTYPYAKLKKEVISRCGESKSQEIRRLLVGEQLSDHEPSELLRVMQRRAENHNVADSAGIVFTTITVQRSIHISFNISVNITKSCRNCR
ncbi:hypothetical protein AVEN_212576-1 [Araneus ventricosus]|uniref:DUF7041 domain-containing protein n=1 Tax=Araneus ventricosus TaxID=182803 RepID=A0A4Y2LNC9_ARAVE|nr:hypothetical protein AVEN_212576-1 [Araneus ventricosus]